MNRQFHKKRQSLKVTDKQAGVGKLFGKSKKKKKWSYAQYKIRAKVKKKLSFKALPFKRQCLKNRRERWAHCGRYQGILGQIGLKKFFFLLTSIFAECIAHENCSITFLLLF